MFIQFNSETNGLDLVTITDDFLGTNSTSYTLASKARAATEAMKIIWNWIFNAYGGWIFDDYNNTTFAESTTNLVANQVDYSFPADMAYLKGLAYQNSGGTWNKIKAITYDQIPNAEAEFYKTASTPLFYRPISNSVKLYPPANFSVTNGLKLYWSRDMTSFLPTDTTKTPGFDTVLHDGVATFMELKFAKKKVMQIKDDLQFDWDGNESRTGRTGGFKKRVINHYSQKFNELYPSRIRVRDAAQEFA